MAKSFGELERLLAQPESWDRLTQTTLTELVHYGAVACAYRADEDMYQAVNSLYSLVIKRLSTDARVQIVMHIGSSLEDLGRETGFGFTVALLPFVGLDPDFEVISTAALEAAQLTAPDDGDALTGAKALLDVAARSPDKRRQGIILGGLTALGDARVFGLIDEALHLISGDAQADLIGYIANQPPTVASIEFLVTRLEQWTAEGQEGPIGHVVPALVRLSELAANAAAGPYYAGCGVKETERIFPSWAAPSGSPIVVRTTYTAEEFGACIAPRLLRLAATESYPRLLPKALRAWGSEDAPFVDAVRDVITRSGHPGKSGLLNSPSEVDVIPDWDRPDCVLEWGILNPFGGPTRVQWCLVPFRSGACALVYVLHNPFRPVCLVLGVVADGGWAAVPAMIAQLAKRFELAGHVLLHALPHWVRVPPCTEIDIRAAGGALFRIMHTSAVARGLADGLKIAIQIQGLKRLRRDPQGEIGRQIREVVDEMREEKAPSPDAGRDLSPSADNDKRGLAPRSIVEEYGRWFRTASAPKHVAAVAPHFLACWNAANAFQRQADERSE